MPGVAGDERLVVCLGLLGEPVTIQEVGHGADLVGDFAAAGLKERQELGLSLPQVEEPRFQFQGRDSPGLALLQLGEPAIRLVELVVTDPVVDEVGQMLRVPGLEFQEPQHLVLVLLLFVLAQVELGQQELFVGIQQVRGAELFEDLDGLAATAGSQREYVGLEFQVFTAVGIILQVLLDQPERLILVGQPTLVQEQVTRMRLTQTLSPGEPFAARSSLFRYSSTLSRRFWPTATCTAVLSVSGSADLPSWPRALPINASACLRSPTDIQHWPGSRSLVRLATFFGPPGSRFWPRRSAWFAQAT